MLNDIYLIPGDSIEASPLALRKSVWKIDFVREKESLDKLLAGLSQTLGTLKGTA
jgi:hypothetical protein